MTPPQRQLQTEELVKALKLLILVFKAPGVQGVTVAGIQGIGVNTPRAAVVAAATVGLARDVHIPKGSILAIGIKSIMVAANRPLAFTGSPLGITIKELGTLPKGTHCKVAPITTNTAILFSSTIDRGFLIVHIRILPL